MLRFRKIGEDSSPGERAEGVLRPMKEQGSSSSFGLYRQLIRTELKVITALVSVTSIHTAELRGQLLMVIQPRPGISAELQG